MTEEWKTAALEGNYRSLADQLAGGADVNQLDRYGQTALMLAARAGHLEAVAWLVDAGASLDHTAKYSLSAMMIAIVNHREQVARLLAEHGADTSLRGSGAPGFAGKNAADLARERGLTELAELLGDGTA